MHSADDRAPAAIGRANQLLCVWQQTRPV